MSIGDVEKFVKRIRIIAKDEKLREKNNMETANIIKLKVAQDTAGCDLREKIQLENNHERVQQDMVEVSMQHEPISDQYVDEFRLRLETLKKLKSTREMSDVLEKYIERIKATVSRCKNDHTKLCEAIIESSEFVKEIIKKQSKKNVLQLINNLQESCKLVAEQKQHLDSGFNDVRSKLDAALSQKERLFGTLNNLSGNLDHFKAELEKDSNCQCRKLEKNNEELNQKAEQMKNDIDEKKMIIEQSLVEQKKLKDQLFALEEQSYININKSTQELELRSVKIEEMSLLIQEQKRKITEMETILENTRFQNANKITEIKRVLDVNMKIIQKKNKELDCKDSTINQLMLEVNKLENIIQKMKNEKAIEQRKQKDRLQEHLKQIVDTVHIMQREAAGSSASAAGSPHAVKRKLIGKLTPMDKVKK